MKRKLSFLRATILTVVVVLCSFSAEATHYRYGNISWQRVAGGSGFRVEFKISVAWRKSFNNTWSNASIGSVVSGGMTFRPVHYQSGSNVPIQLTVTSINQAEDWFYGEFTYVHDYGGPGNYLPGYSSNARISTLINNANMRFANWTRVRLTTPYVNRVNTSSPVSSVNPIVNVPQGLSAATFSVPAIDPDGDDISFRLANPGEAGQGSANPTNVSINPTTGELTFDASSTVIGQLYNVIVVVTDEHGATTMVDFLIRVVQQSTPPAFVSPTPANGTAYQIQPGQALTFSVNAQDVDPGDVVTINAVGLPPGSSMSPGLPTSGTNAAQATFSWTPSMSELGTSVISFNATDQFGAQTSTSVSVNVSLKPVFGASTPSDGSVFCLPPGTNLSFNVFASDPDPTDSVTLSSSSAFVNSVSSAFPAGPANPVIALFSFTPSASHWGIHEAEFTATDSYGDSRTIQWMIIVNDPPVITSTPDDQVYAGQFYSYTLEVSDPNLSLGDELEIESASYPSWLTLVNNNDGTWTLSGTPTVADAGFHSIDIEVADSLNHIQGTHCGHSSQNFQLEVIPCNLLLGGVTTNASCNGGNSGSIDLTVTGANGAISYAWSDGSTTEDLVNVTAGTYNVVVSDAFGCTDSMSFTVGEPAAIAHNFAFTPIQCNGGLSYQSITIAGGTEPYTVTNQSGGVLVAGLAEGQTFSGGATYAANYVYTITDANGCTSSFNVDITQPAPISHTYNASPIDCYGGLSNESITIYGGTAPYTVSNQHGGVLASGLAEGQLFSSGYTYAANYDYTITDANGCTSTFSVSITEPTLLTASLSVTPMIGVNPGGQANTIYLGYGPQSVDINVSAMGGTPGYSYSWSNTSSLSSASGASVTASPTTTTTYDVVVSDMNNCTTTLSVTIQVIDVRCGKNNNKVLVCKVPPGNPGNAHQICVSPNAVSSHLATGSYLGTCTNKTSTWDGPQFSVFPNPSSGVVTLTMELDEEMEVLYQVLDMQGRVVQQNFLDEYAGTHYVQVDLSGQPSGMYMVRFVTTQGVSTERISIQR